MESAKKQLDHVSVAVKKQQEQFVRNVIGRILSTVQYDTVFANEEF